YRYGFNGKEEDPEIGVQDYGERIYNPQISRFLSVDPVTSEYPMLTPYQFASNRPLDGIDLDGLEWMPVIGSKGNITDYSWAGFNADGSAPKGSVGNATLVRGNEIYRYQSSPFFTNSGTLSVDNGSNIVKAAVLYNDGTAKINFQVLDDDGSIQSVTNSQGVQGNYKGATGAQIGTVLNQKFLDISKPDDAPIESDNLGLFDWVGPAELKLLGGGIAGTILKKEVATTLLRNVATKREITLARRAGVRQAWREERALLARTGDGTRRWSIREKVELLKNGKVKGYVGHHTNSVHDNSLAMAKNPDNVQFVKKGAEHLRKHNGNYANPTKGKLLNRKKDG
ncbi:hypothetical protein EPD60_07905, partial [Flaviaesturariibacter flavus]